MVEKAEPISPASAATAAVVPSSASSSSSNQVLGSYEAKELIDPDFTDYDQELDSEDVKPTTDALIKYGQWMRSEYKSTDGLRSNE